MDKIPMDKRNVSTNLSTSANASASTSTSSRLYGVIGDMLQTNEVVKITVTGNSMYPFLRDKQDSVELVKTTFADIKTNDIVMFQRTSGQYVVHRVLRMTSEAFYMVGDAQQWIEGPVHPNQLIARVNAVWRRDKRIPCNTWWWRMLSRAWLWLRPWRSYVMRGYAKVRRWTKR